MEEFNLTNTTKNIGKELENLQTNVTNFLKNDTNYIYILLSLTIVFIILFLLLSWINYTLSLNQGACNIYVKRSYTKSLENLNIFLTNKKYLSSE